MKENYWIRQEPESDSFRKQHQAKQVDEQWHKKADRFVNSSSQITAAKKENNNSEEGENNNSISCNEENVVQNKSQSRMEEQERLKLSSGHQEKQQVKQQQSVKKDENDVNLSFCGCGFLGIYHVGVASCFHEYAPQLSMHKISGSSAGALVAVAHICGNLQLAYATTDILRVAIDARARALGPFHPSFDINATVREALERGLPDDVHLQASGKLHISLTRVYDGENVVISQFDSKEDVIQALLCSCFIPFWSGLVAPKYKGTTYMDGGFSNNLLVLDDKTVTVSPFAGEADICPQDDTFNLLQVSLSNTSFSLTPNNLYRLSHALLPPPPEVLSELCEQGFADGIRYLQRMKLISCTKCLEIRSSLLVTTNGEDMEEAFNDQVHSFNDQVHSNEFSQAGSSFTEGGRIRLEQQEQKMIEINRSERRGSVVSTTSQIFQQQQASNELISRGLDNCDECVQIRQKALCDPLPKQFSDRIKDACDTVNRSLSNWIYSHRPIKYLSYLVAPYYLPIDISLALIYRCWQRLPFIRGEIFTCVHNILDFLMDILKRINSKSTSTLLLESTSMWDGNALEYEKDLIKHRTVRVADNDIQDVEVDEHQTVESSFSLKITNEGVCVSKCRNSNRCPSVNHQLHSLEDTFDSIVDVTSNQEARIFAYYFRDAKNRLQVTEIFDMQRAAELNSVSGQQQQQSAVHYDSQPIQSQQSIHNHPKNIKSTTSMNHQPPTI